MIPGSFIHLNMRQKIIMGMIFCIFIISAIGGLSYNHLIEIESKIHFMEKVADLSNNILEIRRYEKNYFLYGLFESLEENRNYLEKSLKEVDELTEDSKRLKAYPYLEQLGKKLQSYQKILSMIREYAEMGKKEEIAELGDPLREEGRVLVELSEKLLAFEREHILTITGILKTQLVFALVILIVFGLLLIPFINKTIIRPLRSVEKATMAIAQGNFQHIPSGSSHDETGRIINAFNHMVKELEKHQNHLLQAKKLSSLGVLTSGVAHQLNNPLNNMLSSCQIALEEVDQGDPGFLKKMLKTIEQEIYRARDIVKGLLEFSREKEFATAPVLLKDVVERSVRLISSQVPAGIEIRHEIPENLTAVMDSQRMQQVFLNLFMNSIQAIEKKPGEIGVRAEMDNEKMEAVIRIKDTGKGIPEDILGKIFDPFFTTKEVGAGTGLGLSIVYGIIEKHKGTISATSRPDEGTEFTIRLPLGAWPGGVSG